MSVKKALLFPGQGAQFVGMGSDLAEAYPVCREIYDRANDVLGFDLGKLCFEGPEEALTQSGHAQPAIFVTSVACYEALKQEREDLVVTATAGLSSGEWTALYVAGVLSLEDTLRILRARGTFMQEACNENPGAMLSVIGMDAAALKGICEEAGVQAANFNSPQQTVLSGTAEGIARAETLAREAGAKRAIRLKVAGAFHSVLMEPAAKRLAEALADIAFEQPRIPVVSNVTAEPHAKPEEIREKMVRQVTSSVRWVESVQWMSAQGVRDYIECGPGTVLTGLVKRIDKQARLHNIQDRSSLDLTVKALHDIRE